MNEGLNESWKPKADEKDGDYQLIKQIGSGGMGEVWLGKQLSLDRHVAIKFILEAKQQPELEARLKTEALSAARLNHPNITQVIASIRFHGCPALVLEYVEGQSLKDKMRSGSYFSLNDILLIAEQVTRGLAAAERFDVLHRDIKPANLLISDENHLKICDFGLARSGQGVGLTQKGAVLGTVHYMSPEQAAGKTVDNRSDFYSLGVLLFELLEGHLPFPRASPLATLQAHIEDDVPAMTNTAVPDAMEGLVRRLLDKRPQNRPSNCEVLKNHIEITRLACYQTCDMKEALFHSRRIEMRLMSEATQTLSSPRHRVRPYFKSFSVVALVLIVCSALYVIATSSDKKQLALPSFPDNTHLVFSNTEAEKEQSFASPLATEISISKSFNELLIESEFYISKKFDLSKGLPAKADMQLQPDHRFIYKQMMTLLRKDSMKEVEWDFLDKIYNNPPSKTKFLRKEINRLRTARRLSSQKNIEGAISILESLDYSQTKMVTRNFLKKTRIQLIPDKDMQKSLKKLQAYIRLGECDKARNVIAFITFRREQLIDDNYDVYQREIDAIYRYQNKFDLFQDPQHLDMDRIKDVANKWGQLAPLDPQYLSFKKRYELEKNRIYLDTQSQELKKDLASKQRSWDAWSFHQYLDKLNQTKGYQAMLKPYLQQAEKTMAESFCSQLATLFSQDNSAIENQKHKYFSDSSYLKQQLQRLTELKALGWQDLRLQFIVNSQTWNKDHLEVRCQFKMQGRWDNISPAQKMNHISKIRFHVRAQLSDSLSHSSRPTLEISHSDRISQ